MTTSQYYKKCFDIVRSSDAVGVKNYGTVSEGLFFRWYEISEKNCLIELEIGVSKQIFSIEDILYTVKNGKRQEFPRRNEGTESNLFDSLH